MFLRLKKLMGNVVRASDGEIGKVHDFYFDSDQWIVRYLVVDTGEWLNGRRVLLSPFSISRIDQDSEVIWLKLSKDLVRDSPDIDMDRPISRQQEIDLHNYYQWPFYWASTSVSGVGPGNPVAAYPLIELEEEIRKERGENRSEDPNLQSAREVIGYDVQARDGEIGHVDDFIAEDEEWKLIYLVVDTGGWLSGRKVLVSPTWTEQVSWPEKKLQIDLKKDTIEHSPEFDPTVTIDQDFVTRLYDHYGRERPE